MVVQERIIKTTVTCDGCDANITQALFAELKVDCSACGPCGVYERHFRFAACSSSCARKVMASVYRDYGHEHPEFTMDERFAKLLGLA